jgi:hypothetical protein
MDRLHHIASLQPASEPHQVQSDAREALLATLPKKLPGSTVEQALTAVLGVLSQEHFPGGAKSGWWFKAVQLDLEAQGVICRAPGRPVRLYKV